MVKKSEKLRPHKPYGREPRALGMDPKTAAKARVNDLRTSFKNTRETAHAVKGMQLRDAQAYLQDVLEHKRCIPYTRYRYGIGQTAQAKERGWSAMGRWPKKSIDAVLGLLSSAEAVAELRAQNSKTMRIEHIQVNRARNIRRRTYRAHGRVGAFESSPCHVELFLAPKQAAVPKPTSAPQK